MGNAETADDQAPLPPWAKTARRAAKAAWTAWGVFFMLGWLVRIVAFFLGAENADLRRTLRDEMPGALLGWPLIVGFLGSITLVVLAGAVWLAGSLVAGYREPRET